MSKIRKVPVSKNEYQYLFMCPGCDQEHAFNDIIWNWNKDYNNPTLSPSVLIEGGRGQGEDFKLFRCHSFIINGTIEFLQDCTHKLKGETVELPEYKN